MRLAAELVADGGRAASGPDFFRSAEFLEAEGTTHSLLIFEDGDETELVASTPLIVREIPGSDRLDAISEGRYQLQVEHQGLDNRGQHGLDLVVLDQRTERCRPTTSLSGGESFYVSLALALGLADVVRSESGGVSLGTLFIDEGFGSLDADILEEVIDMLEQVRAGEDRVIGLVSHVEVLKQRIDPRISVRRHPQRAGVSTLEVHV